MGIEDTQPPILDSGHIDHIDHIDDTTLALLGEIDLSVDEVRRFAAELHEDDPQIEDRWKEPALLEAAGHISRCASCSARHATILGLSTAELRSVGTAFDVEPGHMEQAVSAALAAFDAEIPVSHAHQLIATPKPETAPAPGASWWRNLLGSRAPSSTGTTRSGGALAFLRQRSVLVVGAGALVALSAVLLRPGRIDQVSTVAISVTTTVDLLEAEVPARSDGVGNLNSNGGPETAADKAVTETAAAPDAGADTVAMEDGLVPAEATPSRAAGQPVGDTGTPVAKAPAARTNIPATTVVGSPAEQDAPPLNAAPEPTTTLAGQRSTPTKKSSGQDRTTSSQPTVKATVPPATSTPTGARSPSPAGEVAAPNTSSVATAAPAAAGQSRSAPDSSAIAVPPLGETVSYDELFTRFHGAITGDPALSSRVLAIASGVPTTGAPGSVVLTGAPCPTSTQQIIATGSGSVTGRPVLIRIVRPLPSPSDPPSSTPSPTFTEIVDPTTCAVLSRQSTP